MSIVRELKDKVLSGQLLSREEAVVLAKAPFEELVDAADEIRSHFCGNRFDLCTIVNGKSGQCSEDCKYCAQSAHYDTGRVESYPLLSTEELVEYAKLNA